MQLKSLHSPSKEIQSVHIKGLHQALLDLIRLGLESHLDSFLAGLTEERDAAALIRDSYLKLPLLRLLYCDFYYPIMPGHIMIKLWHKNLIWLELLLHKRNTTRRCLPLALWSHFYVAWRQFSCDTLYGNLRDENVVRVYIHHSHWTQRARATLLEFLYEATS